MTKQLSLIFSLLVLSACASSPYAEHKSAADVPAHVNAVYLKRVYMVDPWARDDKGGTGADAKADPAEDADPSQNDREVVALAKANILSQLTNFGYTTVESETAPADITMSFFVNYQPERWPLVNRSVFVAGRAYDRQGASLFTMATRDQSAGLIGAVAGASRDEMVAAATRKTVVKLVDEMRKGTLENEPATKKKEPSVAGADHAKETVR